MQDQETLLLNNALLQGPWNFNLPPTSSTLCFPGAVIKDQTGKV